MAEITGRQTKIESRERAKEKRFIEEARKPFRWIFYGSLVFAVLILAIGLRIKMDGKGPPPSGDPGAGGKPTVDPMVTEACQNVTELPSGRMGHFCVVLIAGIETKRITPPPRMFVEVLSTSPLSVSYFDWDGKLMEVIVIEKNKSFPCAPADFISLSVKLKTDGVVTMRVITPTERSAEYKSCS